MHHAASFTSLVLKNNADFMIHHRHHAKQKEISLLLPFPPPLCDQQGTSKSQWESNRGYRDSPRAGKCAAFWITKLIKLPSAWHFFLGVR